VYIDNGNPVPNMPLRSHGLADENKKTFDRMEMIRKKRIKQAFLYFYMHFFSFMLVNIHNENSNRYVEF
jgi:hypothetical protein